MAHASEGGHWYDRKGNPVYQLPKADKSGMRPVTLRDARKLGLVPGVSGISNCAAKPGLVRWQVQQGILSALTLPRQEGESLDDFAQRAMRDSGEQARRAAERGSAIHAAIQGHYEKKPTSEEFLPYVKAATEKIDEWLDELMLAECWEAEKSFAHPLGYGGKADLSSVFAKLLVDFKTKEFTQQDLEDGKQLLWPEHSIQLAAYRVGLGIPEAKCANCFVSVSQPGLAVVIPHEEPELQIGWQKFQALLAYWKADRKYDSAFEEKKAA